MTCGRASHDKTTQIFEVNCWWPCLWQLWSHVSLACELSCSKFNLTSYSRPNNYYGRYKLGLQQNETLTLNRSQRFKCPNDTVTSNRTEGLNYSVFDLKSLKSVNCLSYNALHSTPHFGYEEKLDKTLKGCEPDSVDLGLCLMAGSQFHNNWKFLDQLNNCHWRNF
jgi:hypothetical protein